MVRFVQYQDVNNVSRIACPLYRNKAQKLKIQIYTVKIV